MTRQLCQARKPDPRQRFSGSFALAVQARKKIQGLPWRKLGLHGVLVTDPANMLGTLLGINDLVVAGLDHHGAVCWRNEAGEDSQQGRFARAIRSLDDEKLSVLKLEGDVAKDLAPAPLTGEATGYNAVEFKS